MTESNYRLFAVAPPGIERIVNEELNALGIEGRPGPGGVEFSGGLAAIYTANLWLRSAAQGSRPGAGLTRSTDLLTPP
jgi:putative N6-adenine-specific DNA methylase